MLDKLKKSFGSDKDSVILKLLGIIEQQQDFISKNIKERVVYLHPDEDYTNADRFVDEPKEEKEDEFEEPEDLTPEELQEHMEGKKKEGKVKNE